MERWNQLCLRPYRVSDQVSLIEAINAVCAEGRWMATPHFTAPPAWRHALAEPMCPYHSLLVAVDGEHVAGWCRVFPETGLPAAGELGIGLLAPYRNRGLGAALMRQSLAWADRAGLEQLLLTTRLDNSRALHLFRQCGFQPLHPVPTDRIRMACRIKKRSISDG